MPRPSLTAETSKFQSASIVVLAPAACYPIYPQFTGTLPENGRLVDVQNWVFRHEPSPEPTRMQSFRIREMVRAGKPEQVADWRDMWLERGLSLLRRLGWRGWTRCSIVRPSFQ